MNKHQSKVVLPLLMTWPQGRFLDNSFHNRSGFYIMAGSFHFPILSLRQLPSVLTNESEEERSVHRHISVCLPACTPAELGPIWWLLVWVHLMDQSLMHSWMQLGSVFKFCLFFICEKCVFSCSLSWAKNNVIQFIGSGSDNSSEKNKWAQTTLKQQFKWSPFGNRRSCPEITMHRTAEWWQQPEGLHGQNFELYQETAVHNSAQA